MSDTESKIEHEKKDIKIEERSIRTESRELKIMRDLHSFAIETAQKEVEMQAKLKQLEKEKQGNFEVVTKPLNEAIEKSKKDLIAKDIELSNEKAKKNTSFAKGVLTTITVYIFLKLLLPGSGL